MAVEAVGRAEDLAQGRTKNTDREGRQASRVRRPDAAKCAAPALDVHLDLGGGVSLRLVRR